MTHSYKYLVGATLARAVDFAVRHQLLAIASWFPRGHHLMLDLRRYSGGSLPVVFDVGANIGQTCLHIRRHFPQSTIHSFEPVPSVFEELQRRTSRSFHIETHNLALGDQPGEVRLRVRSESLTNSLFDSPSADASNSVLVRVVRVDDFCTENSIESIDLLKIDVEGFELQVLRGAEQMLRRRRVKYIYVEAGLVRHMPYKTHFAALDEFLQDNGYMLSNFYETFPFQADKSLAIYTNCLYILPESCPTL